MKFNELGIISSNNSSIKAKGTLFTNFNRQTAILAGSNSTVIAQGCTFDTSTAINRTAGNESFIDGFAYLDGASVGAMYGIDSFIRVTDSTIVGYSTLVSSRGDIEESGGRNTIVGGTYKPESTTGVPVVTSSTKADLTKTNILPTGINTGSI